jgi:hypothetical protein
LHGAGQAGLTALDEERFLGAVAGLAADAAERARAPGWNAARTAALTA